MDKVKPARTVILIVILSAMTVYTYLLRSTRSSEPVLPDLDMIPMAYENYSGDDEPIGPESLRMLGADATSFRVYRDGDGRIYWFFLGFFASQQENSQIHSPKHCYPGSGWDILEEGSIHIEAGSTGVTAKSIVILRGADKRLVIYWFWTRDGVITDEFSLKWHQMKSCLLARPPSAAFIRFSTTLTKGEQEESREALIRFIERLSPDIETVLDRTWRGHTGTDGGAD